MAGARKIVLFDESRLSISGRKLCSMRVGIRHYFGFRHQLIDILPLYRFDKINVLSRALCVAGPSVSHRSEYPRIGPLCLKLASISFSDQTSSDGVAEGLAQRVWDSAAGLAGKLLYFVYFAQLLAFNITEK